MVDEQQLGRFLELCQTRYKDNLILFAKEVLNFTPSNQQEHAMGLLITGKRKLAIKSGHGTGKSAYLSCCILWFLCCHPDAEVRITAPSSSQLYGTMMKEIRLWYNKSMLQHIDMFEFTKDHVRLNHKKHSSTWFAKAVSVANPENISGTHAKYVMIVVDEGAGVEEAIYERLDGALTTPNTMMLIVGNPSFTSGYFYDLFHKEKYASQYDLLTFNSEESSNVDPIWVQFMKDKYGEDSNVYKVRVLGEFAPLDEEVIIRRCDVDDAIRREDYDDEIGSNELYIGVDLSSGVGNDSSVICIRKGNTELTRDKLQIKLSEVYNKLVKVISQNKKAYDKIIVNIDTTGLGIQIGQDLFEDFEDEDHIFINQINFGNRANDFEVYANIFTEMFFNLQDKIKEIKLLDIEDSTVSEELGSRRFGYDVNNKFIAEKKKEFIKRIGHSPDEGDAVLLAFYEGFDSTVFVDYLKQYRRR